MEWYHNDHLGLVWDCASGLLDATLLVWCVVWWIENQFDCTPWGFFFAWMFYAPDARWVWSSSAASPLPRFDFQYSSLDLNLAELTHQAQHPTWNLVNPTHLYSNSNTAIPQLKFPYSKINTSLLIDNQNNHPKPNIPLLLKIREVRKWATFHTSLDLFYVLPYICLTVSKVSTSIWPEAKD